MSLEIGTKIRWESSIGVMRGTIKNIVLAYTADGKINPFIDVEYVIVESHTTSVRLCATDSNLKMMRVTPVVA